MRYYRLPDNHDRTATRLVAVEDEMSYDLSAAHPDLTSVTDLAQAASIAGVNVDDLARRHFDAADSVAAERLNDDCLLPVAPDEVWAAGVTYAISEEARTEESALPDIYVDVYDAERPEVFFKATPSRTVGPGESVGVRGDSGWNVPEPELGVVLYRGDMVGYTVGNDVSSRDIEGANPLYLPQAKVYRNCCALGPCVASPETVRDPHDLEISMEITRDGETAFRESTSTAELVRTCEELVSYLVRHNADPECAVLLTGTSLVPSEEFSLRERDTVRISVEGVGTLENVVARV